MKNNDLTQLFKFEEESAAKSANRQIEYTAQLNAVSHQRALDLLKIASQKDRTDLHPKAQKIMDGNVQDCMNLINEIYDDSKLASDAEFMKDAEDDVLDRLLESRRSDRSKTKAKGLNKNMTILVNYVAATYAEMLVRKVSGKQYNATVSNGIEVDENDKEAIGRKIKSLQSKKSRLSKVAQYDPEAKAELDQVVADIARLNELRGVAQVSTKQIIKDADIDTLRNVLGKLEGTELTPEQQEAYDLIKNIIAQ